MRTFPLLLSLAALAGHAKADKFWLEDPAVAAKAEAGSLPAVVDGVLVAEKDGIYEIRTVGGTLFLPKASVFRIDRDELTVAAIETAEKDAAAALEAADQERRMLAEAVRRDRNLRAAEASARRSEAPRAAAPAPQAVEASYDPVLDIVVNSPDPLRDLQIAFGQTRDRAYIKALRKLRRER